MSTPVSKLSAPVVIQRKTVKNRVVVPPMVYFAASAPDGLVTDRHLRHYRAFAAGGAGLVIVQACVVSKMVEPPHSMTLYSDACLPGMGKLAQAAQSNGAVALVQLINLGLEAMPEESIAEIGRDAFLQYKADFISAALRCRKAGFDGVELHAAHGYYLDEVLETSARTDEYGGSLANRVRLIQELISEIKALCGRDFIVAVRFGCQAMSELPEIATALEAAGVDVLDISTGMSEYHDVPADFPFDGKVYAAARVKGAVTVPVICVGNITTGDQAERILSDGYADMVAVGRGQLSDPAWANKTFSGKPVNKCRNCRECHWFADAEKCPARRHKR